MSDKNTESSEKGIIIQEGTEVKGGLNAQPSTPRPSQPPKGQSPQQQQPSQQKK